MKTLYERKPWYSIEEAAKRLTRTFGEEVTGLDVIQFIIDGQLLPSWFLHAEMVLRYSDANWHQEGDEPGGLRWKREDLKLVTGIYGVVFAHGDYSTLKINLRNHLMGKPPRDQITAPATFLIDDDGTPFYLMRPWGQVLETWGLPDKTKDEISILDQYGRPFERYDFPYVDDGRHELMVSSAVPDLSEIIITKKSLDQFEESPESESVYEFPTPIAAMSISSAQDTEILQTLVKLGYEVKALPADVPGRPGVKKRVRDLLNWPGKRFDKAWERLLARGEIRKR
jgi:hypothetical protein